MALASKVVVGVAIGLGWAYLANAGKQDVQKFAAEKAALNAAVVAKPIDLSQQWATKKNAFRLTTTSVGCEFSFQMDRIHKLAEAGIYSHAAARREGCYIVDKGAVVLQPGDIDRIAQGEQDVYRGNEQLFAYIDGEQRLLWLNGIGERIN